VTSGLAPRIVKLAASTGLSSIAPLWALSAIAHRVGAEAFVAIALGLAARYEWRRASAVAA